MLTQVNFSGPKILKSMMIWQQVTLFGMGKMAHRQDEDSGALYRVRVGDAKLVRSGQVM